MTRIHLRLIAVVAMLAPLTAYAGQAPATADGTVATTVRVATYNVQVRRSLTEFRSGVLPLLGRSDIVGLQEMDTREKEALLAAQDGWGHYAVRPSYQQVVLWRSDRFSFVSGRVAQISGRTYIGSEVAKMGAWQKPHYVSVVRLLDKVTGRRVSVIDAHLVHGAVKGGRGYPGRPKLFRLYKAQLVNLAGITAAERRWGRTFVLGDFNVGWVADRRTLKRRLPIRTFAGVGMTSMWAASRPTNGLGTRLTALLDQVWSDLRPLSARVQFDLAGFSDHRPAIAAYATD